MLKTNSKKARENIRAWIASNCDATVYDPDTNTESVLQFDSFEQRARHIMDTFCGEFMRDEQRRRYNLHVNGTWQGCFEDWLRGLPYIIDSAEFLLGCDAAKRVLGEILEETEEERERYTNDEAERLMSYLIWREVSSAAHF